MSQEARALLSVYNEFFLKTSWVHKQRERGKYIRAYKDTPERLQELERVIAWCSEKQIEPRHWLYTLFCRNRWAFPPALHRLISKQHLSTYKTFRDLGYYKQQQQTVWQADRVCRGAEYDPNVHMTATTEAIKNRYQIMGNARNCLESIQTETLGYHPKSNVCLRCTLAEECKMKLCSLAGFNIIALRKGDISLEQARIQELARFYGAKQ